MKIKKNDINGYIVSFIFGLIFSVFSLFCYFLFNISYYCLSLFIITGNIIGYKLYNKKIYNNKKIKIYLFFSSLIINFINIWFTIPFITNKYFNINLYNNYVILMFLNSILCFVITIILVLLLTLDFKISKNKKSDVKHFLDEVENIFKKNNALSKENAVDKKIINQDLKNINMSTIKKFFLTDVIKGIIIKSYKNKLYYKKNKKDIKLGLLLSICFTIVVIFLSSIVLLIFPNSNFSVGKNSYMISNKTPESRYFNIDDKFLLKMPDWMKFYSKNYDEDKNRYYYQYLSRNVNKSNIEIIEMYYYDNFNMESINDNFFQNIKKSLDKYEIIEEEIKELNNRKIRYFKLANLDNKRYVNSYYVVIDNKIIEIYIYINKEKYKDQDGKKSDKIIESIKLYNK